MLKNSSQNNKRSVLEILMTPEIGLFVGFIVISLGFSLLSDRFLSFANFINVTRQVSIQGIVAVSMTMLLISGNFDLSVGSIIAVSGVTGAYLIQNLGVPIGVGILGGILSGGIIGFINGIVVAYGKVNAFIATLSWLIAGRGLAFIITGGRPIFGLPQNFQVIGRGHLGIIPYPSVIMIVLFIAGYYILTRTRFGRYVYAIGSNEEAARLSGVNTKKMKLYLFIISGLLAGLAGVILASRLGSGQPTAGEGYELEIIAAVVLGGTSLMGGIGKIHGTFIGVFLLGVLNNGLNLMGVSSYWQSMVMGMVILVAVLIDQIRRN